MKITQSAFTQGDLKTLYEGDNNDLVKAFSDFNETNGKYVVAGNTSDVGAPISSGLASVHLEMNDKGQLVVRFFDVFYELTKEKQAEILKRLQGLIAKHKQQYKGAGKVKFIPVAGVKEDDFTKTVELLECNPEKDILKVPGPLNNGVLGRLTTYTATEGNQTYYFRVEGDKFVAYTDKGKKSNKEIPQDVQNAFNEAKADRSLKATAKDVPPLPAPEKATGTKKSKRKSNVTPEGPPSQTEALTSLRTTEMSIPKAPAAPRLSPAKGPRLSPAKEEKGPTITGGEVVLPVPNKEKEYTCTDVDLTLWTQPIFPEPGRLTLNFNNSTSDPVHLTVKQGEKAAPRRFVITKEATVQNFPLFYNRKGEYWELDEGKQPFPEVRLNPGNTTEVHLNLDPGALADIRLGEDIQAVRLNFTGPMTENDRRAYLEALMLYGDRVQLAPSSGTNQKWTEDRWDALVGSGSKTSKRSTKTAGEVSFYDFIDMVAASDLPLPTNLDGLVKALVRNERKVYFDPASDLGKKYQEEAKKWDDFGRDYAKLQEERNKSKFLSTAKQKFNKATRRVAVIAKKKLRPSAETRKKMKETREEIQKIKRGLYR